ncbi:MAG: LysR family transcriptional regulator [Rhodobacter sp.]|uniref:LysR family transcriptional regulator n=1 Tax=Pararhodobacter sp. TaxID=2127056 RepID=UPI001DD383DA|nr:LysR family transcriptional regulator [Pararhodobacter sp.]MCB1346990.1 LysR family transcriptional regulator [Paracoccaceae bacterium]MCC0073357.1 LysR family transcriptional regulator [Rhodobacter sp.]HPD91183.1 LysR family transcriptional regulator [Pararhodobacter sp.]
MEVRQIQYFVAIAELEHFGRASQRLRIAQPALSRQMKLLEAELRVPLFERLPRGVRLTPAGRVFLDHSRGVLHQLAQAAEAARAAAEGQRGTLRLGFIEAVAWHGLIPDALRQFRAAHPDVDLSLAAMQTSLQIAALRREERDAALVYNATGTEDLTVIPVDRHEIVLAVPFDSPLADKKVVSVTDLRGQPMIGFMRKSSPKFFDEVHTRFRECGVTPHYLTELESDTEILALVSAGTGIGLTNSMQRHRPPAGVHLLRVHDLDVWLELCLVHRTGEVSPTLRRFMDILVALSAQQTSGKTL